MENILDRSKNYLSIFTKAVQVDYNLKKWKANKDNIKKTIDDKNNPFLMSNPMADDQHIYDSITLSKLSQMDKESFNIYLGERVVNGFHNFNYSVEEDILDYERSLSELTIREDKEKHPIKTFIKKIKNKTKKYINSKFSFNENNAYTMNVLDFFDFVKFTAKKNEEKYVERIEPYMIALKRANDMGQQSLVDELAQNIFINKFESILHAEGFCYKITEEQVVNFVKKTEKGVRLSYIKNFKRPIPLEVIEQKKKADDLLVFDNYCVLYYDPEEKSYGMTKEELEKERIKKSDPILFGMISGSRDLYYITDWVDEWCDLTLDEFIKVSGIEKEHLKIDEKINI